MPREHRARSRSDPKNLCISAPLRLCVRVTYVAIILSLFLIAGCGGATPTPLSAFRPTQGSTLLPLATPTLDVVSPEQIGTGFLNAWQDEDYTKMYGLLTPALRNEMTAGDFQAGYLTPLDTTTTVSVTVLPDTLNIDNGVAWIDFREIWHTALFGDLQAHNRLNMVRSGDQWWVDWDQGAVWPDLADGSTFGIEYQIPPRANIYDDQGAGLAVPASIVTVGVVPNQITDETLLLNTLSQVLGMTPGDIQAHYAGQPADWYLPIADITSDESLANDAALQLPGIERRERQGRLYPLNGVGAHVIGWLSQIPAEDYRTYRAGGLPRRRVRGHQRP